MRWLSDLAQKLWVRLAEWMTKEWWVLEVRRGTASRRHRKKPNVA